MLRMGHKSSSKRKLCSNTIFRFVTFYISGCLFLFDLSDQSRRNSSGGKSINKMDAGMFGIFLQHAMFCACSYIYTWSTDE